MPLYSFKKQFVPFIKDGSKTQTVRRIRKNPPKVGQPCTLVTGSRFKPVSIIETKPEVARVDTIIIIPDIYCFTDGAKLFLIKGHALNEPDAKAILNSLIAGRGKILEPCIYSVKQLSTWEREDFAYNDGFRANAFETPFEMMVKFWNETHELNRLPGFVGHVTHWLLNYKLPF